MSPRGNANHTFSGRGEDGKQNMREQEKKQTKTEPRADVGTWFHTARIKYAENRGTDAAEAKTRESSMKTWATSLAADRAAARAWGLCCSPMVAMKQKTNRSLERDRQQSSAEAEGKGRGSRSRGRGRGMCNE